MNLNFRKSELIDHFQVSFATQLQKAELGVSILLHGDIKGNKVSLLASKE